MAFARLLEVRRGVGVIVTLVSLLAPFCAQAFRIFGAGLDTIVVAGLIVVLVAAARELVVTATHALAPVDGDGPALAAVWLGGWVRENTDDGEKCNQDCAEQHVGG